MMEDVIDHIKMRMIVNQQEQIRLQKEIIDEIFLLLCQYVSADELDHLPCVAKINHVAMLHNEMEHF